MSKVHFSFFYFCLEILVLFIPMHLSGLQEVRIEDDPKPGMVLIDYLPIMKLLCNSWVFVSSESNEKE